LSGNHLLIPYRELTSNIGMLFYNTLSATRKILRRIRRRPAKDLVL